jgi:Asp-tRNA(Asn)/Glu-tRNA(Gln) amidotransferase C subunit
MTDLAKVQLLEAENRKLQSELEKLTELVKKVEEQRDGIYWEYESIRYTLNEQLSSRTLATAG